MSLPRIAALWMGAGCCLAQPAARYGFSNETHLMEIEVRSLSPYHGKRLGFFSSLRPEEAICYSDDGSPGGCAEKFEGAVTLVRYSIRLASGVVPTFTTLREDVTLTGSADGLPWSGPFSKVQEVVDGVASDIQAFGYDAAKIPVALRRTARRTARQLWRTYRQELRIASEPRPVAVILWKHTPDRIQILDAYAPPPETRPRRVASAAAPER